MRNILSYHSALMIQTPNEPDRLSGLKLTDASEKRTEKTEVNRVRLKKKKIFFWLTCLSLVGKNQEFHCVFR